MEPTSIDLDYDVEDIEDVEEEGAVDALVDVDLLEVVEVVELVPMDSQTTLEVVLLAVDLLDFVKSLHIVVDRYLMDEVVEDRHSFQFPNCVLKQPIVPQRLDNHYPIPMHGYRRQ